MSQQTALTAPALPNDFKVALSTEALKTSDDLKMEASFLEKVATEKDVESATILVGKLKGFSKSVEKSRKEIKDPFWNACLAIDAAAKKASEGIEKETKRIESLIGGFKQKQLDEARAAREAAEKAAREAAAQAAALLEKATSESSTPELIATAEKAQIAAEDAAMVKDFVPVATLAKQEGGSVRETYTFEVSDIHALYKARPDLVELAPKKGLINAAIANGTQIPGLLIKREVKFYGKASNTQADAFLA